MVRKIRLDRLCVSDRQNSEDSEESTELVFPSNSKWKVQSLDSSYEIVYCPPIVRGVRFASNDIIHRINNFQNLSSKDRKQIWFRSSELKRFRREEPPEETQSLQRWEKPIEDDFFGCQRRLHKLMAVSAVLDEQEQQRREGVENHLLLAQRYSECISRSKRTLFAVQMIEAREHNDEKKKQLKFKETLPVLFDDDEAED